MLPVCYAARADEVQTSIAITEASCVVAKHIFDGCTRLIVPKNTLMII